MPTVTGEPVEGVIVYPVIALPPLLAGAVQLAVTFPLPATSVPMFGAPGTAGVTTPVGVTLFETDEATLSKRSLAAFAVAATAVPAGVAIVIGQSACCCFGRC